VALKEGEQVSEGTDGEDKESEHKQAEIAPSCMLEAGRAVPEAGRQAFALLVGLGEKRRRGAEVRASAL
jgi:hypothetical protein